MFSDRAQNSVLVVSVSQKITDLFNELLPPSAFYPIVAVSSCGEAKRELISSEYDIIVINAPLSDEFGSDFALDLVQNSPSAVLLLVSSDIYGEVSCKVENYGVMTVSKPLNRTTLYTAMKLAYATRARLRMMDKKNKNLSAKMSEIRIVNRAKWTLIESLGMTEEQAHHYIERQAMDMRLTKGEIAVSILNTYGK
ncbi:MAG: ANTAR domain-containing protein [Clostridiales bacterium]|jgi:AmiR/NasT family two-component response regulator|nr:ANTAR domain-containing protein [Clostridiales bacterium]